MRIILEAKDHVEAQEALSCAISLLESDHQDCLYKTSGLGNTVWAKRTKSGVSSRVMNRPNKDNPHG